MVLQQNLQLFMTHLRSGVPVCLVKYENLPYFYFDNRYRKKTVYALQDIYRRIFLEKFHEDSTLPGGVDLIFESAGSMPLKLNQLPPVGSDFHETLGGVNNI